MHALFWIVPFGERRPATSVNAESEAEVSTGNKQYEIVTVRSLTVGTPQAGVKIDFGNSFFQPHHVWGGFDIYCFCQTNWPASPCQTLSVRLGRLKRISGCSLSSTAFKYLYPS